MVGQLLEQLGPGLRLALGQLVGKRDRLRRLARHIMIGALQRDIDEAGDLFAIADRDLARDQRRHAHRLQRGQQVADPAVGLVDAVDEDEVRNAKLVEHPEGRGGERGARRVRVDDDDGDIGDRHARARRRPKSRSSRARRRLRICRRDK